MTRLEDKHIDIDSVIVNGRHRQDLGDLESLAASIRKSGLLQPVVVTVDRQLIAGQRRLEALRLLGWDSAPVRVMANLSEAHELLIAERDENTCRLDMKLSEKVALGIALEELEQPKAQERQGARTDLQPSEKFPEGKGETREIVGAVIGMSGPTYQRAKAVVIAADSGDSNAAEALAEMDRTGKVTPAYEKVVGHSTGGTPRLQVIDLTQPKNRVNAEAKKGRLAKVIYGLEGTAQGFGEVDFRYILAVAESAELAEWDRILALTSRSITALRKRLKEGTVTE